MSWFNTLFSKTFIILGSQLLVTFIGAKLVLAYIRRLYAEGTDGIAATKDEAGELDIDISWVRVKPYFYGLLIADIALFLTLLFVGINDLTIGIPVFIAWSAVTGAQLALALISVDENLGARVLAITVNVTVLAALIAIYSGVDFSFLEKFLFFSLLGLIFFGMFRIFANIQGNIQRIATFFGVAVFTGYLLYDFNHLQKLGKTSVNDWHVAMSLSIDIYLDIINLFLHLLDLLSN
jgi:FtsH-binding integral membrane protein